ncbi:uncharacterized protein K02A2.6-like [Armigeres subalbatus]|uniref:uncharacterized protein K02A2.6-like n=1 Tax=Armigeres subalbatus TaxID=124917 RepID=UPI002ED5F755
MKSYLRSAVWWPKLDADAEKFVKSCRGCTLVSAPDVPEPMLRRPLPTGPWEDIAIDFIGPLPEGQYLLVLVDCYSRFLEICEMSCIDCAEAIGRLREVFGRFGVPSLLKADNGPQFASEEFKTFCREYGIQLVNTIPYWPQMNGQVERQNRSILKRLRIAQELGKDWRKELSEFILVYHSTNHATTGESPSKLMFGRRTSDCHIFPLNWMMKLCETSIDSKKRRERTMLIGSEQGIVKYQKATKRSQVGIGLFVKGV